jgi:uncharacterized protein YbjT (DUF2867 family)
MKRILVAGAPGYLGRYVVKEFKKQGYWIRALARSADRLDDLKDYVDEAFIGAVTDPAYHVRGMTPIPSCCYTAIVGLIISHLEKDMRKLGA